MKKQRELTIEELLASKPLTYPKYKQLALFKILAPRNNDFLKFCKIHKNDPEMVQEVFLCLTTDKYREKSFGYRWDAPQADRIIPLFKNIPDFPFSIEQKEKIFNTLINSSVFGVKALKLNIQLPTDYRKNLLDTILADHSRRDEIPIFFKSASNLTQEERDKYLQYILVPPTLTSQYSPHPFTIHEGTHANLAVEYLLLYPDDPYRNTIFDICFKWRQSQIIHLIKKNFPFTPEEKQKALTFLLEKPHSLIQHETTIKTLFNTEQEYQEYKLTVKNDIIDNLANKYLRKRTETEKLTELINDLNNHGKAFLSDKLIKQHLTTEIDILTFLAKLKIKTLIHILNTENKEALEQFNINENLTELAGQRLYSNRKERSSHFINAFISKIENSNIPESTIAQIRANLIMKIITQI